jgi:phenylalanyl-tRNA synthetase beta chain
MGLALTPGSDLSFQVPMYRTDILHECDVAEDLAISYGYDNVVPIMPPVNCIGTPYILNKVCDIVREEICHCGYNECLNFALCSIEDLKCFFRVSELTDAVVISNPKTKDFQVGRTTLLPGMLKTLYSNKKNKLPIQLFEVSDVVLLDPTDETGAKNQRRVAVLYSDTKHSCLDVIFPIN